MPLLAHLSTFEHLDRRSLNDLPFEIQESLLRISPCQAWLDLEGNSLLNKIDAKLFGREVTDPDESEPSSSVE